MSAAPPGGYVETRLIDPFEIYVGPVFETGAKGAKRYAFKVEERHLNGRRIVHGGMLMTFADAALGQAAWDATDHAPSVTLQMQVQFQRPAHLDDLVEVTPLLMRRTNSLLFIRGDFCVRGETVMAAASLWKLLGKP